METNFYLIFVGVNDRVLHVLFAEKLLTHQLNEENRSNLNVHKSMEQIHMIQEKMTTNS